MKYQEIEGDLIQLALQGEFDVIAHGCNCQCVQQAGIAKQMVQTFDTINFPMEASWHKGNINKLGQIDSQKILAKVRPDLSKDLWVINCYTQFMYGTNHTDGVSKPLDYEALTLCLRKINYAFKGKHIGLPLIGCHLAGGVWDYKTDPTITGTAKYNLYEIGIFDDVKTIIKEELKDMNVTIVHYKPS